MVFGRDAQTDPVLTLFILFYLVLQAMQPSVAWQTPPFVAIDSNWGVAYGDASTERPKQEAAAAVTRPAPMGLLDSPYSPSNHGHEAEAAAAGLNAGPPLCIPVESSTTIQKLQQLEQQAAVAAQQAAAVAGGQQQQPVIMVSQEHLHPHQQQQQSQMMLPGPPPQQQLPPPPQSAVAAAAASSGYRVEDVLQNLLAGGALQFPLMQQGGLVGAEGGALHLGGAGPLPATHLAAPQQQQQHQQGVAGNSNGGAAVAGPGQPSSSSMATPGGPVGLPAGLLQILPGLGNLPAGGMVYSSAPPSSNVGSMMLPPGASLAPAPGVSMGNMNGQMPVSYGLPGPPMPAGMQLTLPGGMVFQPQHPMPMQMQPPQHHFDQQQQHGPPQEWPQQQQQQQEREHEGRGGQRGGRGGQRGDRDRQHQKGGERNQQGGERQLQGVGPRFKKECAYFKNPRGCSKGDACGFLHVGPNGKDVRLP